GAAVSVRSSAEIEDGRQMSCAGIFSSFLNIRDFNHFQDSIKKCWASCFSNRARHYLAAAGIDLFETGMAIVVMRMIDADSSGVAFSVNPASSDYDQVVVDSVPGIGEGLVSGLFEPDHFVIRRSDRTILSRDIAQKKQMLASIKNGNGLEKKPVAGEMAEKPSLEDEKILQIVEAAMKLEKICGSPQDIEWAFSGNRLYLLQTRPITCLVPDKNVLIWDNANVTESYSGISSPLTFSAVRYFYYRSFKGTLAANGVPEAVLQKIDYFLQNMLGYFNGHIYYNLVNWYNMIFVLPGIRHYKGYWEQMIGVRETLPEYAQKRLLFEKSRLTWADHWFKFKLTLRLIYLWFSFEKTVNSFIESVTSTCREYMKADLENQDLMNLARHYRDLETMLLEKWHVPNINDFYTIMFFGALKSLSEKFFGSESTIHNDLLTGEGNIISTEPARRAVLIAKAIKEKSNFKALFDLDDNRQIYGKIQGDPCFAELRKMIDQYIEEFGFRCMNELKFESEDLFQKPENLITTLKNYLNMKDLDHVLATAGSEKRKAAESIVDAKLTGWRRKIYNFFLAQTRNSVRNRENLRFQRTRVYGILRRIFNGAGRYLANTKVINHQRDIYFLGVQEIFSLLDGTSLNQDIKALIELRRKDFNSWQDAEPEDRFVTRGLVYTHNRISRKKFTAEPGNNQLKGISCSPGTVTGIVRVIDRPDADLRLNGEILAAKRTDPGWVVLYPSISALLIEKGSLVSHSAIVAREMGIPTIVSIPGLTERLKSGDQVRVDAGQGTITIQSSSDPA
ncbi:MAG: PEP/pyruvate-binding domain-containing protein, partial [Candidatus Riflebacteria bacterium]